MHPRGIRSTITPSPMTTQLRSFQQDQLIYHLKGWLQTYADSTSGVEMRADATVEFDDGNQEQVAALLRIQKDAGGQSRVDDGRVEGAPELIVETFDGVSPTRVRRRQVEYSEKGVTESILVDREGSAPWYCPGNYTLHPTGEYIVSGTTFPGLKLNLDYFYDAHLSAQLVQLKEGLGSGIHRWYEERLEAGG